MSTLIAFGTIVLISSTIAWMVVQRFRIAQLRNDRESLPTAEDLTEPDFAALEEYFGKPLPDDLRWLYAQRDLIVRHNIERRSTVAPLETYLIARFLPATLKSVNGTWVELGRDQMPIAIDEAGNYYAVEIGTPHTSTVVYIDHEGGQWIVASSLREFIIQGDVAPTP